MIWQGTCVNTFLPPSVSHDTLAFLVLMSVSWIFKIWNLKESLTDVFQIVARQPSFNLTSNKWDIRDINGAHE